MSDVIIDWHDKAVIEKVKRATDRVLKRGAQRIRNQARRNISSRDGTLRRTVNVLKSKFGDGYLVAAGAYSNPKAYYAPFVELGTPGLVYQPGKSRTGRRVPVEKKPYLRPALKANRQRIMRDFKNALDKV